MSISLFITGTDTGCGKTYVTRLLVKHFKQHYVNCIALKPIASGCERIDDKWINDDVMQLMAANQLDIPINQWLFHPPIAPHFAALDDGMRLQAKSVVNFCQQRQYTQFQLRLIEGAGGLMVPLNESETWIDMVKLAQMPLIVVVGIRLGCINHALQMNEVIKAHQLPVVGWIANVVDKETSRIEDNINAIQARVDIPLIATVSYGADRLNSIEEIKNLLF